MLPTKFRFIWPSCFRGEDFFNRPIRKKNCLWWPCLLMDRDEMRNLYRGPSIDASYQISDQLALRFERRRLKCDGRQTTGAKWWQKPTLPLERWAKKKIANKKQEMSMIPMFFLPNQDEIRIFFVEDITNIICVIKELIWLVVSKEIFFN